MTPHLIVQWGIALIIASLAATAIACALAAWDDRQRIRHGRIPLQPLEPIDTDPALARPISAELRQAIAERENGNG